MGGLAMLTLSDTENNLHFILILQGLIKHTDKGKKQDKHSKLRFLTPERAIIVPFNKTLLVPLLPLKVKKHRGKNPL